MTQHDTEILLLCACNAVQNWASHNRLRRPLEPDLADPTGSAYLVGNRQGHPHMTARLSRWVGPAAAGASCVGKGAGATASYKLTLPSLTHHKVRPHWASQEGRPPCGRSAPSWRRSKAWRASRWWERPGPPTATPLLRTGRFNEALGPWFYAYS